ncbi:cupin domain-containing protein [uncultured Nitratireductor sp.]|uniref:cupin domain-containing protein n=1 Tax=uncultured Nitratireductor sp. TaxID=520953 RepID=UPI0025E48C99|nr:cupin domain-containing protein [uncultured Nitratireductor sp.]
MIKQTLSGMFLLCVLPQSIAFADQQSPQSDYRRVEPLLDTNSTILDQKLIYPSGEAQLKAVIVTLMPGEETGRHMHAVPLFGHVLEGELAIHYEGTEEKTFKPGDSFIEALNVWHNGRVVGEKPARILAVFIGNRETPPVIRP